MTATTGVDLCIKRAPAPLKYTYVMAGRDQGDELKPTTSSQSESNPSLVHGLEVLRNHRVASFNIVHTFKILVNIELAATPMLKSP